MSEDFRTDQTVNVDTNLSREEIARLGRARPFWDFVNFPLVLSDVTYTFPKDHTEKVDIRPLTLEITDYVELDPNILINVEKTLELISEPKKETYISPFTGRVM